jgi:hypothetical protein
MIQSASRVCVIYCVSSRHFSLPCKARKIGRHASLPHRDRHPGSRDFAIWTAFYDGPARVYFTMSKMTEASGSLIETVKAHLKQVTILSAFNVDEASLRVASGSA